MEPFFLCFLGPEILIIIVLLIILWVVVSVCEAIGEVSTSMGKTKKKRAKRDRLLMEKETEEQRFKARLSAARRVEIKKDCGCLVEEFYEGSDRIYCRVINRGRNYPACYNRFGT